MNDFTFERAEIVSRFQDAPDHRDGHLGLGGEAQELRFELEGDGSTERFLGGSACASAKDQGERSVVGVGIERPGLLARAPGQSPQLRHAGRAGDPLLHDRFETRSECVDVLPGHPSSLTCCAARGADAPPGCYDDIDEGRPPGVCAALRRGIEGLIRAALAG